MKAVTGLIVFVSVIFTNSFNVAADADLYGMAGDINGDYRIGLQEAIYALQVVAGIKSDDPSIEENKTITDSIGYEDNEEDLFKITMPANGLFQFSVTNLEPSDSESSYIGECFLHQEDGANLVYLASLYDYSSRKYLKPGQLYASPTIAVFENGVYYIKVPKYSDHTASYELQTSFSELQAEDRGESDNIHNESQLIQESGTVASIIGYGNDKEDWYKIQMSANGLFQFSIKNTHSEEIWYGCIGESFLYQEDGADLIYLTSLYDYSSRKYLKPGYFYASPNVAVFENGIYYIKIPKYGYDAAPYQLKTAFTNLQYEDTGEPDNSQAEAQLIQENEIISAIIGYGADREDWYEIRISANGTFQFSVENLHSEDVTLGCIGESFLYQKDGADLVYITSIYDYSSRKYLKPGYFYASSKVTVVENGVYYIKIPKIWYDAAPYQLKTSFSAE